MCENDFLLTYNSECLDRHSDTSDFGYNEPSSRGNNHSILRRKLFRHIEMSNYEKEMRSSRYKNGFGKTECVYENHVVHHQECTCNKCIIPVEDKIYLSPLRKRKIKYSNEEDNKRCLRKTPSRLSVVRSKIMPCLSNIFGRSNHSKRDDLMKEKHVVVNSTKDNCCQVYCIDCNHKRPKKYKKSQNYVVQSLYSTENGFRYTPESVVNIKANSAPEKDTSDINCGLASSSIATNIHIAKRKFRKMIDKEFKKAYLKRLNSKRTQEQQFPSKPNFQIFAAPKMGNIEQLRSELRDLSSFGCNVIPTNSSVFWEYLVERINKKYQTKRGGLIRSCHCTNTTVCPNANRDPLLNEGTGSQLDYKTNEQSTQGSEPSSFKGSPTSPQSPTGSHPNAQVVSAVQGGKLEISGKPGSPAGLPDKPLGGAKQPANLKVQCNCHPEGPPSQDSCGASPTGSLGNPNAGGSPEGKPVCPGNGSSDSVSRPCQDPHDQIKETLERRYNGEILCIHNPPCILINGCLNLPPVKGQFSPTTWPVTQVSSYHNSYHKLRQQNQDQGCQYQAPSSTEFQLYPVGKKTEKMTQSICNHDPPCEVVRCCYKPEFDPKLENSCVHVPMCQRLPACVLNESEGLAKCGHQPRCVELPLCKREAKKYTVLTAKDDISTQVRPIPKMECKHVPPCIMIPKCLGKLMCEGYVPYEAIPDCVHQPRCEMIPACCRKCAKMVSRSCQYPASCRIV